MPTRLAFLCVLQLIFGTNAFAQDAPITDCDKYAASDLDPQRKAAGIPTDKINPALAVPACEQAVLQFPNSPRLTSQLGRAYQRANDFVAAVQQYRKAADKNYAFAQNSLGGLYLNGQGVSKNDAQAFAWFRKAADQGLAAAQSNLGFMYANGRGVPRDVGQAIFWSKKAADQGLAQAQDLLGQIYEKIVRDNVQAIEWYRRAAEQGLPIAQENLRRLSPAAAERAQVVFGHVKAEATKPAADEETQRQAAAAEAAKIAADQAAKSKIAEAKMEQLELRRKGEAEAAKRAADEETQRQAAAAEAAKLVFDASKGNSVRLSQNEITALRAKLMWLWDPPTAIRENPDQYVITLRIRLARDWLLDGQPVVISSVQGPRSDAARDSIMRAVVQAQPYDMLSPNTYDAWREMDITFDPHVLEAVEPTNAKTAEAVVVNAEPPVTDCDTYAANDADPQRKTTGVPFDKVNPALAVPACETAVRQYPNSIRLTYQLGRAYHKANNFAAAMDRYRKAAEQNYAAAQNNLGIMYLNGQGVPNDAHAAAYWFRKAAEQGLAQAQFTLGIMYAKGQGVPQDAQEAVIWCRKAAEQGLAQAQFILGVAYESGEGVPQDNTQAIAWYRKAADKGNKQAKAKLDEIESLRNAKRDADDVVAQVLNYTTFGKDEGLGDNFWYKEPSAKCLYRLHISDNKPLTAGNKLEEFSNFMTMFSVAGAAMQRKVIDLDELDPKNLTFRYDNNPTLWGQNGAGTIVQHISDVLFFYMGTLDLNRLERGWSLIYSKYCRGKEKPF